MTNRKVNIVFMLWLNSNFRRLLLLLRVFILVEDISQGFLFRAL